MASETLGNSGIHEAWNAINKGSGLNWFVFAGTSGNWNLVASGANGLSELKTHLDDSAIQYVVVKVDAVDVDEGVTKHPKFGLGTWVGPGVGGIQRRRVLGEKQEVHGAFSGIHANFDWNSQDDLNMHEIGVKLAASQGAHKPNYYEFGAGHRFDVK